MGELGEVLGGAGEVGVRVRSARVVVGAMDFEGGDAVWGSMWEHLVEMVPDDFEQAVVRRPVFQRLGKGYGAGGRDVPVYRDDCQFVGYRWVCPGCKKPVRK